MTGRVGRRFGAAAALAIAILTLAPSSPAQATAAADPGPVITIDQPAADSASDSSAVTVSGSAAAEFTYQMSGLVLSIGSQTSSPSCTGTTCTFSWKPTFAANGSYTLDVTATEKPALPVLPAVKSTQQRTFSVNAPPQKPTLDPPTVTDGRTVELTWSRNSEPDMLYYAVFRKDPAASKYLQVGGKVTQPTSGAKVSFTDTTTSFNGGAYAYQVVAVRKGATAGSEKTSDPSTAGTATVPAPPTTTTALLAPGAPGGGPATTTKPGPPAGVDLSGFLSSRSQPAALPPITVPEAPDTGFQGTLPFGARPPGDTVEDGTGEAASSSNRSSSIVSGETAGRPLVPVAAGLILLLLAMHIRTLNRRLKPVGGDLPVDLTPSGPPPPPARRVRTQAKAKAPPSSAPAPAVVVAATTNADPAPSAAATPGFFDVEETDWAPETDRAAMAASTPAPKRQRATAARAPALEPEPSSHADPHATAAWTPAVDAEPERLPVPGGAADPLATAAWAPAIDPDPEPAPEPVPSRAPDPDATAAWAPAVDPEPEPAPPRPNPAPVVPPTPPSVRKHRRPATARAAMPERSQHPERVAPDDEPSPPAAPPPAPASRNDAPAPAPEPAPALLPAREPAPAPVTTLEPELLYELEPAPDDAWAAHEPSAHEDHEDHEAHEPSADEVIEANQDEVIEVVEVVSPTRRHLARSGRR